MTGFEYTAAVHMLYEGQLDAGLKCIGAIRARYDGHRRSPFDEAECGHHYARAMASWAAVLALTGFRYSGVERTITFGSVSQPTRAFWSNGSAWGTCERTPTAAGVAVALTVLHGSLALRRLVISEIGSAELDSTIILLAGDTHVFDVAR
jgi:non-lysosomal glucosylceramidase